MQELFQTVLLACCPVVPVDGLVVDNDDDAYKDGVLEAEPIPLRQWWEAKKSSPIQRAVEIKNQILRLHNVYTTFEAGSILFVTFLTF